MTPDLPPPSAWEAPGMLPDTDPPRTARYRRLQSWHRAVQLGAPAGRVAGYARLGSWLGAEAVTQQRDLNFLHPAAHELAEQVAVELAPAEGRRLFHDLLWGTAMCVNLVGALRDEPGFLLVLQRLFDPAATAVLDVRCAWTPPDPAASLGDRTAYDAVVLYETAEGPAFLGLEVRYAEPVGTKPHLASPANSYEEVTLGSGWFADPEQALVDLPEPVTNRWWRDVMLTARLDAHGSHGRGSLAVVALDDDPDVRAATDRLLPALSEDHAGRVDVVPVQAVLRATEELVPGLRWWVRSFRRRYLDPNLVRDQSGRDPLGPVLGRSLVETAAVARAGG